MAVGRSAVVPDGTCIAVGELNMYFPVPDDPNVKSALVTSCSIVEPVNVKLPVSAVKLATPTVPVYLAPET